MDLQISGLAGKVVLVTGGSSGVGREACLIYGRQGCKVVVHYRAGRERAEAVVRQIREAGGEAVALGADLRTAQQARGLIAGVQAHYGALHILVNNAGDPLKRVPFEEVDEALWEETLALNLSAPFWLTQAAVPLLEQTRGVVLFVSTSLTRRPGGKFNTHYTAAKGGVNALTLALAAELSPKGIRVNCLGPGIVPTALQQRLSTPERLAESAQRSLLKRLGTAEEIAATLVFLTSDAAGYIEGQVIFADGG